MLLLGGFAYLSLTRVQFSASLYKLLPADLPEVRGMDWLNRFFSQDGQLIVTVSSPDPELSAKTAQAFSERLRDESSLIARVHEEIPLVRLAREGGGLLAWLWFNAEPVEVRKLADRLAAPASGQEIAGAMARIEEGLLDQEIMIRSYDPLVLTNLPESLRAMKGADADAMASPDGRFRLFYVEGSGVDFSDYRAAAGWLREMKNFLAAWRMETSVPAEVKIGLTGHPAFMAEVGSGMERDMTMSVVSTMALIALLFWVMHRQSQPLGWLIAALCLVLILTLNLGGLIFGKLSVMSAGFAAILLGLAVDYGIILYREAMTGEHTPAGLRRSVGPSILWAAATTAIAFLVLNFSSLPGIAEMGNLVALGIALGAGIMLWGFSRIAVQFAGQDSHLRNSKFEIRRSGLHMGNGLALVVAGAIPLFGVISIWLKDLPQLAAEFHPFRIRTSPSMIAWQEMQHSLRGRENSIPVVVTGDSMEALLENLSALKTRLESSVKSGALEGYMLPFALLPEPKNQRANREILRPVVKEMDRLGAEIDAAGFSDEGTALTREVLQSWASAIKELDSGAPFAMPGGTLAQWSIGRLFYRDGDTLAALGSVRPVNPRDRSWVMATCDEHSAVASLGSLGTALNERIKGDLKRVFLPMIGILTLTLGIVFRSWKDWFLAVFSMVFSGFTMILLTQWTPLSWNSFNICGLPLLFGTGLDFGIHMIFGLRRAHGNLGEVRSGLSKALLFCGLSSAIGFGSLAFSSAHGLASLGQICAVGILINMVIAVWLLPRWYRAIHGIKDGN